jgi:antitoxin component YwqK of YwqJK toxin-antitoxin module
LKTYESYFSDGKLREKYSYKKVGSFEDIDGYPKEGIYIKYYDNGQLEAKGNYVNGKKVGVFTEFHENGRIKNQTVRGKLGKKISEVEYYSNGNIKFKRSIDCITLKNGKKLSFQEEYDDYGYCKKFTYNYPSGVLDGDFKVFDNNGRVTKEVTYDSQGYYHGFLTTYDRTGKIEFQLEYVHGDKNGIEEDFYFDEQGFKKFRSRISYKMGKRNGLSEYYSDGKLTSRDHYINDEVNGISETFREGILLSKKSYLNDELNGVSFEYHWNGQIKLKTQYKNGKEYGVHEEFNENGILLKRYSN